MLVTLIVLAAIGAGAWFGWRISQQRAAPPAIDMLATAPAPCPDDPNDLAGIEGWAPGAGQAEKIGQTGAANIGTFGGGLAGGAATPAPAAKKCTAISPQLDRYFARIAATGEAIPATDYDAGARAAVLDANAETIFAFVRDRVATEAYAGAMRGANGTLAAHGGSPADKALLLAALLSAKQIPVRFVHGPLSAAETDAVIRTVLASQVKPVYGDPEAPKKLNLDPAQVAAAGKEQRERVKALADEGIARARTATDALLASTTVQLAASDAAVRAAWTAALSDHWWLQAQQNGTWTDLDPTLADAKPGAHLTTASGDPADALPDALQTTVTIRMIGTFFENGASSDKMLLEATAKTADLALSSFSLVIGDHSKGALALTEARSFTPSLRLAGRDTNGDAFEPDASGRLAVLRLQIVTQVPGGAPRNAERVLIDRSAGSGTTIDPAWTPERTALALTATYMGLVVTGELSRDFTAKQDAQSVKLARAFAAYAAAGGNGRQLPPPGIAEAYPYEVMHYFLYDSVARMRLEDQSNGGLRFFFDRPQIAMVHRGFTQHGKQRTGIIEFDIVENGMSAAGTAAATAVRTNAVRGYLDTSIERHVLGVEPAGNTIALFDAAGHNGLKPRTVAQGTTTRIEPGGPVTIDGRAVSGWWELDPQTGNLVGRMAGGAGQAMVEYAIDRVNDWASLVAILQFYGDFFRCIAMGVEAPLSGSANPQADFANCALGALCNLAETTLVGEGFARCDVCTNIDMLIYNFLDYGTYGKSASPGSLGFACGKLFPSPF
jgi:transglutaminase-like putative cysteine protease